MYTDARCKWIAGDLSSQAEQHTLFFHSPRIIITHILCQWPANATLVVRDRSNRMPRLFDCGSLLLLVWAQLDRKQMIDYALLARAFKVGRKKICLASMEDCVRVFGCVRFALRFGQRSDVMLGTFSPLPSHFPRGCYTGLRSHLLALFDFYLAVHAHAYIPYGASLWGSPPVVARVHRAVGCNFSTALWALVHALCGSPSILV